WMYKPLEERSLLNNTNGNRELRLNTMGSYSFLKYFKMNATYQYLHNAGWSRRIHAPESYYVRDLVNQYTQVDGTTPIPFGGILDIGQPTEHHTHSGRVQLDMERTINENHQVVALGGAEI